jgi:DNA-binding MarR family transcriptional regulator
MAKRRISVRGNDPPSVDGKVGANGAPPLLRVPLALARHFIQICTAAADETVAREGMKTGQFSILVHVGREPGLDQNGIAARMGVDRARVSQLAEELEAMGLIERRVNGADRRARMLRLTPRGEEVRARLQPLAKAAQMHVVAPLSPRERELLFDLLVRVIQANRTPARPDAGQRGPAKQSLSASRGRASSSNRI